MNQVICKEHEVRDFCLFLFIALSQGLRGEPGAWLAHRYLLNKGVNECICSVSQNNLFK